MDTGSASLLELLRREGEERELLVAGAEMDDSGGESEMGTETEVVEVIGVGRADTWGVVFAGVWRKLE